MGRREGSGGLSPTLPLVEAGPGREPPRVVVTVEPLDAEGRRIDHLDKYAAVRELRVRFSVLGEPPKPNRHRSARGRDGVPRAVQSVDHGQPVGHPRPTIADDEDARCLVLRKRPQKELGMHPVGGQRLVG